MKMKKLAAMLLAVAMVIGLLAGCGSGNTPASTPAPAESTKAPDVTPESTAAPAKETNFKVPAGGYDGSAVTIRFYHNMSQDKQDLLKEYIAEFNKAYPNITVDFTSTVLGSYDDIRDQIKTEINVGSQPNIAYCYPDHVALYNMAKATVQLDSLIASTESDGAGGQIGLTEAQISDFIGGYYTAGASFGDGLMYTMPFSKSTEVLYYNKTFFDANGLTVPATWDEMKALCAKIKEIDPNCIPLGYDSESNWFITMCEQYKSPYTSATGEHYLFNNETNRAFVKEFNDWYNKGYLTTQGLYGAYTSGLFTTDKDPHSYMSIGSSAGATYQRPAKGDDGKYPFEVGIAMIPQIDTAAPKVISQGPDVCIFMKSNPQEVIASWLLVKFLTTNSDFQAEFAASSGYVPVLKSAKDNAVYAEKLSKADGYDNIAFLSAKVCLEQADAYYVSPAFNGSSTARDQVAALMKKCLVLTSDIDNQIEAAFEEAVDECEYSE